jgi:hypothetical protein
MLLIFVFQKSKMYMYAAQNDCASYPLPTLDIFLDVKQSTSTNALFI